MDTNLQYKPILKLDWCSYEAAKFAVTHWYYTKTMPTGKLARLGVWENNKFIGVLIFGSGGSPDLGTPYGLGCHQVCELTRIALKNHSTQISRMLNIGVKLLHKANPDLRLIVTFANASHGHHGGIYQGAGWIYTGCRESIGYKINGVIMHGSTVRRKYKNKKSRHITWLRANIDSNAERVATGIILRYCYPLDAKMKTLLEFMRQPYPKKCASSETIDTSEYHSEKGGAAPTDALQI